MKFVGKVGKFTSENDGAWGKKYGNKHCKVVEAECYESLTDSYSELLVEFEDGKQLTITGDEFEEILN